MMQTEEMIGVVVKPQGMKVKGSVVAVVGNPNCGKTALFNVLTGLNQRVGNWPGVTVDRKTGHFTHNGTRYELVDLPGIYSLSALSRDEVIARDYIMSGEADLIVNIVDASNPDRNLYLTSRLLEMQVPVVVALNMTDVAAEKGIETDVAELSQRLATPVIPLVASRGEGVGELKDAIAAGVAEKRIAGKRVTYPEVLDKAIREMSAEVSIAAGVLQYDPAWLALKLLEGDDSLEAKLEPSVRELVARRRDVLSGQLGDDADIVIADTHYRFVGELSGSAVKRRADKKAVFSDRLDQVVLNRFLGIPVFLLVMYLMFLFTINIGGAFIDFFDIAAGALFVDGFGLLLASFGSPEWLVTILATGLGGALQTMATFIPPIGFMFIFLSILEDSGYMARAAYVMDRGMRATGLPGKAFIPMLIGFGCSVPAIMSARTMNDERDRIMTVMMVPFMSCGARLPVYALFAAAFFPAGGQNLVFLLYLLGITVAVLTGFILRNTLLRGEVSPFIMEMPPYHLPTLQGIGIRVWERLKSFLFKAGKVLVPVIMILSFMNSLGTDGSFGNEDTGRSVLSVTGKSITPAFRPFGLSEENWPAAVGLFTGIFAKEAVVGTLDNLYAQMAAGTREADREGGGGDEGFSLSGSLGEAFATIPANLAAVSETLLDPLGISIGDVSDTASAAEEQEVSTSIFGSMVSLFDGTAGAFAYLVFILLYFPCSAAIAAVYRETNLGWTIFAGAWTTVLAYIFAVIAYQTAIFSRNPALSSMWIAFMALLLVAAAGVMYMKGGKGKASGSTS